MVNCPTRGIAKLCFTFTWQNFWNCCVLKSHEPDSWDTNRWLNTFSSTWHLPSYVVYYAPHFTVYLLNFALKKLDHQFLLCKRNIHTPTYQSSTKTAYTRFWIPGPLTFHRTMLKWLHMQAYTVSFYKHLWAFLPTWKLGMLVFYE